MAEAKPRGAPRPASRPSLMHRVFLPVTLDVAWRAITDPRFTEQYLYGLRVRSDWKAGARIVYESVDGEPYFDGAITEIEHGRKLSFSVRILRDAETAADLPSRVTFELNPVADGCELLLVHDDFAGQTASFRTVEGGWPGAMKGLFQLLAEGHATAAQAGWAEHLRRPETFDAALLAE